MSEQQQPKENIADETFSMELTGDEIVHLLKAVGTATSLWAKNRRQCPAAISMDTLQSACNKVAHATDPRPHPAPATEAQQRIDLPMHHVRLLQSIRYVILKSHKTYPEYIAGTSNNRRDSIKFMQWLQKENPTAKVRAIGLDEYILESGALLQAGRK